MQAHDFIIHIYALKLLKIVSTIRSQCASYNVLINHKIGIELGIALCFVSLYVKSSLK